MFQQITAARGGASTSPHIDMWRSPSMIQYWPSLSGEQRCACAGRRAGESVRRHVLALALGEPGRHGDGDCDLESGDGFYEGMQGPPSTMGVYRFKDGTEMYVATNHLLMNSNRFGLGRWRRRWVSTCTQLDAYLHEPRHHRVRETVLMGRVDDDVVKNSVGELNDAHVRRALMDGEVWYVSLLTTKTAALEDSLGNRRWRCPREREGTDPVEHPPGALPHAPQLRDVPSHRGRRRRFQTVRMWTKDVRHPPLGGLRRGEDGRGAADSRTFCQPVPPRAASRRQPVLLGAVVNERSTRAPTRRRGSRRGGLPWTLFLDLHSRSEVERIERDASDFTRRRRASRPGRPARVARYLPRRRSLRWFRLRLGSRLRLTVPRVSLRFASANFAVALAASALANPAAASAASALAFAPAGSEVFRHRLVRASNFATAAAYTAASASSTNFHAQQLRNLRLRRRSALRRGSRPLLLQYQRSQLALERLLRAFRREPHRGAPLAVLPSAGRSSAVLRRRTDSTYLFATPMTAKSSPDTRDTAAISSFVGTWFPCLDPSSPPHGIPLRRFVWHPRTHAK